MTKTTTQEPKENGSVSRFSSTSLKYTPDCYRMALLCMLMCVQILESVCMDEIVYICMCVCVCVCVPCVSAEGGRASAEQP